MEDPLRVEAQHTNTEMHVRRYPPFSPTTRNYLLGLATIVALSVAYYFAVALPTTGRAKLEFEKEKYAAEQKEKADLAQSKKEESDLNESFLGSCLDSAERKYWSYVKLNGTPVPQKADTYTAPQYIWDAAAKQKKDAISECQVRYGK